MKKLSIVFLLFSFTVLNAQSRTCYVFIKEKSGDSWYCPKQDESYEIHTISEKLNYTKTQKVLNEFKERFKAGDKKSNIKQESVTMDQEDYLIIYEYNYAYSEKIHEKCKTNIARKIQGFAVSNLKEVDQKLTESIEKARLKKKYVSHRIIDIHQPYIVKNKGGISASSEKLLQLLEKQKDSINTHNKAIGVGVRG
ncbi:hypothetical protein FIA58_004075 [Flavobacterium jejuense]|uniref:Uncharacterized protein n=1 Tax=Flavobacterium jejuense TaxID=1544455 RepID=A0ABX0IM29_9FLAO|nr:hypothetical protein [Flavobacterium jejuense]NHN24847.1 hypothetical protein [Flavobacterium jejuense]